MRILLTLWVLLTASTIFADDLARPSTGTLIISYHTGRKGERLDRVRVRLLNERQEQTFYPIKNQYQETRNGSLRRIVVSDLEPGLYTLEFVVPNQDGLFEEVPRRELTVAAGSLVKIDQAIRPHYAHISAHATFDGAVDEIRPTVTLYDKYAQLVAQSTKGELEAGDLLPGEYRLVFEPQDGYLAPESVTVAVSPGAALGPFERSYVVFTEPASEPSSHPRSSEYRWFKAWVKGLTPP